MLRKLCQRSQRHVKVLMSLSTLEVAPKTLRLNGGKELGLIEDPIRAIFVERGDLRGRRGLGLGERVGRNVVYIGHGVREQQGS